MTRAVAARSCGIPRPGARRARTAGGLLPPGMGSPRRPVLARPPRAARAGSGSARSGHPPPGGRIGGVERFIDRLRGGKLRPYTPDAFGDPVEYENTVREQVSEEFILRSIESPTNAELGQLTRFAVEHSPVRGVGEVRPVAAVGHPGDRGRRRGPVLRRRCPPGPMSATWWPRWRRRSTASSSTSRTSPTSWAPRPGASTSRPGEPGRRTAPGR